MILKRKTRRIRRETWRRPETGFSPRKEYIGFPPVNTIPLMLHTHRHHIHHSYHKHYRLSLETFNQSNVLSDIAEHWTKKVLSQSVFKACIIQTGHLVFTVYQFWSVVFCNLYCSLEVRDHVCRHTKPLKDPKEWDHFDTHCYPLLPTTTLCYPLLPYATHCSPIPERAPLLRRLPGFAHLSFW